MEFPHTHQPVPDYLRLDAHPTADGWRVRLDVHGELDSQTSSTLLAAVTDLVARPPLDQIVLDLGKLTFIDAAGIRCLLQCEAVAERNGVGFEPRDASPAVVRILDIVGLAAHFGFEDRAQEASGDHADQVDDLMIWSLRARRQAHDICLRAQHAVRTSSMLRDVSPTRPTR
jgi:anti-anti-sigma factor